MLTTTAIILLLFLLFCLCLVTTLTKDLILIEDKLFILKNFDGFFFLFFFHLSISILLLDILHFDITSSIPPKGIFLLLTHLIQQVQILGVYFALDAWWLGVHRQEDSTVGTLTQAFYFAVAVVQEFFFAMWRNRLCLLLIR